MSMDFHLLFKPLPNDLVPKKLSFDSSRLSDQTQFYAEGEFPDWRKCDVVIVGCPEDRGAREMSGSAMAPDQIRRHLYRMTSPRTGLKIADLGNVISTDKPFQYHDRLAEVVETIVKTGKLLILLGGSQDIVYGQYKGYEKLTDSLEYVVIDSELDVEDSDFGINNHSYNHKIFLHSPNYLQNFTNLGYQSYFVSLADKKRLKNLYFEGVRLGQLREDLKESEPYLRNANMVSFDMSSVRSSDAPGTSHPSPAGFTSEEIVQLARYAAMSNRVSSVSICEVQPMKDFNGQTSMLSGILIWYLIEGYYNRRVDEPDNLEQLTKYSVSIHGGAYVIVFYRNPVSERWWMEVPYSDAIGKEDGRTELIPCSKKDYEMARLDEIPEKWWLTHYKLK